MKHAAVISCVTNNTLSQKDAYMSHNLVLMFFRGGVRVPVTAIMHFQTTCAALCP